MLTPRELRQIEFRRVFRGYDPQEVDEFLARLIEEYEKVFKERQPDQARPRQAAPEGLRPSQEGEGPAEVREAVELARQAADELRANAQWEARLILDEARQRAARIEEEARQQAAVERTRLRELREEADRLLRQLRRLADDYLQASPEAGGSTPRSLPRLEEPTPPPDESETRSFPIASLQPARSDDEEEDPDRVYRGYSRG